MDRQVWRGYILRPRPDIEMLPHKRRRRRRRRRIKHVDIKAKFLTK